LKQGTSEEQYKMLGYAENFAHNNDEQSFFGLLLFPSDVVDTQTFTRGATGRLTTLRTDFMSTVFAAAFDGEILAWLRD
jgi:hypothetical protein